MGRTRFVESIMPVISKRGLFFFLEGVGVLRVVAKNVSYLRHVHRPLCLSVRVYQRVSDWTNFHEIWSWALFNENLPRKSKFGWIRVNIWHFSWRIKYALMLRATLHHHYSALFVWNGIDRCDSQGGINFTWTRRSVTLYVHCLSL